MITITQLCVYAAKQALDLWLSKPSVETRAAIERTIHIVLGLCIVSWLNSCSGVTP
jgi:hypothetical protein